MIISSKTVLFDIGKFNDFICKYCREMQEIDTSGTFEEGVEVAASTLAAAAQCFIVDETEGKDDKNK